jgi:hypothetical protein
MLQRLQGYPNRAHAPMADGCASSTIHLSDFRAPRTAQSPETTESARIGLADTVRYFFQEHRMKVQTGIKAGRQGVEASHGGKPRPIGKGV